MLAGSAALHLAVLVLLLVGMKLEKPPSEPLPPPSVAVIFQGGAPQGPTQPNPVPDSTEPAMPAAPAPTPEQPPTTAPQAEPEAAPPQPEQPAPPAPEQQATPVPPEVPPEVRPGPPMPPAPPRVELALPPPTTPSMPFTVPELPPPPPPPAAASRPPAPQRSAFAPMFRNWSLGQQAPAARRGGQGPSQAGSLSEAAAQIKGAERLGTDWRNALAAWVEEHKYYPQQAVLNNEDGSPQVEVRVRRDGKVQSVLLETRSGSQWLDLALQALFRGASLPRFPDDSRENEITFTFTMHYILVRR